ncbi:N-ethylammeline chlorohydrolase, partial [Halorubrum sp. SS7]
MPSDIVIHDAYVLTVNDSNQLYERGTLRIDDGRITDVRTTENEDAIADADHVIDGDGMVAMPGLVNTHTHLELTPLIGAFSDLGLLEMMGGMTAIYGHIADGEYDYLTEAGYKL